MELNKEWYSVIVQAIGKDNNFQDTCEDVLTTMLNTHLELIKNINRNLLNSGNFDDFNRGYIVGTAHAIELIMNSKPTV